MGDFLPILLSNAVYLIFVKALANRLLEVIVASVGPFQSAFIPGRLADDAMVAGEILALCQKTGTKGFMWHMNFATVYDADWKFLWSSSRRRFFLRNG